MWHCWNIGPLITRRSGPEIELPFTTHCNVLWSCRLPTLISGMMMIMYEFIICRGNEYCGSGSGSLHSLEQLTCGCMFLIPTALFLSHCCSLLKNFSITVPLGFVSLWKCVTKNALFDLFLDWTLPVKMFIKWALILYYGDDLVNKQDAVCWDSKHR